MSKTVLVADESVTIRSVAESLLRGEAYSVRSAADGQMALELARTERPDLVLVGEKLPGLSGAEICQALKADSGLAGVPIVFMRADRPGSAPPEADAVLTKPFSPQAFLETVHGLLAPAESATGRPQAPISEMGVADELIDQALGIDDVGPAPALEMEVNRGTELGGEPEESLVPAEEGEPAFGALEESAEPDAGETPTVDPEPLEFSTQIGLEDRPPAGGQGAQRDSDLERALDLAFGSASPQAPSGQPKPPIETPASSMAEISLGDLDSAEADPGAPAVVPPAAATPSANFTPLDEEPEPERPHDYDWFIQEMEKESKSPGTREAHSTPEPPRIEPVATDASDAPKSAGKALGGPSEAPRSKPGGSGRTTGSGIEIEAKEMQASNRGYDEFISEFRKEIAKLEGALPSESRREEPEQRTASGRIALSDNDMTTAQPVADVKRMGDELIADVTQKIARELAAKIDPQQIYSLIEAKLKGSENR